MLHFSITLSQSQLAFHMMSPALHMSASAVTEASAFLVEALWTDMDTTQQNVADELHNK